MRKDRKYMICGASAFILGWLAIGYGYGCTSCYPFNTPCFCLGILLSLFGIFIFVIGTDIKSYEK